MTIHISNKSLTEIKADVIVNAANGVGIMGSGTAGAIANAAGPRIRIEFSDYCRIYNPKAGMVFMTRPWDMKNCGRVYHAVTMKYPGVSYRDDNTKGLEIVRKCIDNIFDMLSKHPSNSIAIPALATGIGGLDVKEVARIMITQAKKWGHFKSDKKIIFCDLNKEFLQAIKEEYMEQQ